MLYRANRHDLVRLHGQKRAGGPASGGIEVGDLAVGLGAGDSYVVEDLLDGATYTWRGEWNFVRLGPARTMAHVFVLREPSS